VSGALSPFRDAGLYEIACNLTRHHKAAEAEAILFAEVERLGREGPTEEELEVARTRLLTRLYRELRTNSGKAEALGHHHTTLGDYRTLFAAPALYREATVDDVRAAAARLFDARRSTVIVAVPDPEAMAEDEELGEGDGEVGDDASQDRSGPAEVERPGEVG
jgi:predicted Zn-dependent peptidase